MLVIAGCGGSSSTAPTVTAQPTAPTTTPAPLALAGQSNALFMQPFLASAAAPMLVVGFAQDGSKITQWDVNAPEGYWAKLAPSLHGKLTAFVWWQGESDTTEADLYLTRLIAFIARVRAEAGNPSLKVLICRVVNDPAFQSIRAAQAAYVAQDPFSVLVSSDGLQLEHPDWPSGSAHLSNDGYVGMAARVLAAAH
jgi:hypothetical protein